MLALLLVIAFFVCCFGSTALAATSDPNFGVQLSNKIIIDVRDVLSSMGSGRNYTIEQAIPLKDLSGNVEYALLTFEGKGYAIISLDSGTMLEALPDGYNPYSSIKGDPYYAGPLNYLYKDSLANLYSITENKLITEQEIASKMEELSQLRTMQGVRQQSGMAPAANPASYIVTYSSYIKNTMPFGNNVDGTCGSVAAGMMLTCLDAKVYGIGKVVPLSMPYGEKLHQSLIPYCEMSSGGSMPDTVAGGINRWLTDNANNGTPKIVTAKWTFLIGQGNAETSIASNKACVVSLGNILGSPYGDHMVLAYGYYSNTNGYYYNAHVGWTGSGYSSAIINRAWASGAVWIV